jgi:hypothetical protein
VGAPRAGTAEKAPPRPPRTAPGRRHGRAVGGGGQRPGGPGPASRLGRPGTLASAERLAFVLHDIFAVPFEEIAAILDRSPAAARQLASRARRRVRGTAPPRQADLARQRQVVDAFPAALRDGIFGALLTVLDPDVVFHDDSAALPAGAPSLMRGARAVAGYALTYSRQARFVQPALLNGTAGLAIAPHGRLIGAIGFTFRDGKIAEI